MIKWIALLLAALSFVGCTSSTEFGSCVGMFEDKQPGLQYKYSTKNVVLGIVFFQTVFVPALVILNETYCPIGNKE